MKRRSLFNIVLALLLPIAALAQQDSIVTALVDTIIAETPEVPETLENPDTPENSAKPKKTKKPKRPIEEVYQGMILKLDVGSTAIALATSSAKIQHYELAMNWRVIQRLYPTFEIGYAGGTKVFNDSINYRGHGGFFRVGLDISPLKKHPESPHALLVGVRLGTAVQQMAQSNLVTTSLTHSGSVADCWGEIVAGCQVNVAAGLYMGWMGRFKCLFTRVDMFDAEKAIRAPMYIPGFGARDDIGWGVDYHIGYRF